MKCLLCGRRPQYLGVFVPKNQAVIAAPPSKVRTIAYALCRKCKRKGMAAVEKVLQRDIGEMAARN